MFDDDELKYPSGGLSSLYTYSSSSDRIDVTSLEMTFLLLL